MMKAAPAPSFIMIEPKFLLEVLVIPLDPPAQLGHVNQIDQGVVAGKVESQYLDGSWSPAGHSISSHSSGCGSARP